MALFNVAQWLSGNEDEYFRCLPALEACETADFYDKLFKGYAENWFLSERALNHLDAAVKERPDNHVAKALRANALVLNGLCKPSAASGKVMVTEGLEDLSAVLRYWTDTPWLLGNYVDANIAMMNLSHELGQIDEANRYSRQTEEGVDKLLSYHDSQHLAVALDWFAMTDQDDRIAN